MLKEQLKVEGASVHLVFNKGERTFNKKLFINFWKKGTWHIATPSFPRVLICVLNIVPVLFYKTIYYLKKNLSFILNLTVNASEVGLTKIR